MPQIRNESGVISIESNVFIMISKGKTDMTILPVEITIEFEAE